MADSTFIRVQGDPVTATAGAALVDVAATGAFTIGEGTSTIDPNPAASGI
jgi:hypothetical protein